MRRSHVQPRRAFTFALVALSAAAVVPASASADGLTPTLPATPAVGTPTVATPTVAAPAVPTVATPTVDAAATVNAASASATVTASTRSGVRASVSTQASTNDQATERASRSERRAVRGERHARAHKRGAHGDATRALTATLNCPLPGPKEAVHCTNFPTGGALEDKCNSSMVTVSGTMNFITTVTVNLDGTMTITTRENFQNVTGYGEPDNAYYQANDKDTTQSQIFLLGSVAFPIDQNLELITIKPAQLPNQILHVHEDITVDVNPLDGTPTISGAPATPDFKCTG